MYDQNNNTMRNKSMGPKEQQIHLKKIFVLTVIYNFITDTTLQVVCQSSTVNSTNV